MDIHSNEKFIKVPASIVPQLIKDINVQVLAGYSSDSEFRLADRDYIYSRPILPIPVLNSPLLVTIMYYKKDPNHWKPRYSTSIATLSMLRTIQSCYSINKELPYYMEHRERIDAAITRYRSKVKECDNLFFTEMQCLESSKQGLSEQQGLTHFIRILETNTYAHINAMEMCIMEMFNINYTSINLLTERPTDPIPLEQTEVGLLDNVTEHFLMCKQQTMNVKLEKTGNEQCVWFQPTNDVSIYIPEYKFLSLQRVREYYNYCLIKDE